MARATVEHALGASALDDLFDRTAERGYTKELLFSTTVDLMSLVVCGKAVHLQAAFMQMRDRVPVTLKCLYEKVQRVETVVSSGLVSHVADRCDGVIRELGGTCAPLLEGYWVKILDGNHLAGTQKRLKVLRGHTAAALPGQCLAVLDPQAMLVTDVIPCEDGHAQERSLLDQVLPLVEPGDVWVEDRNFCTVDFLLGISARDAFYATRRHGNTTVEPQGDFTQEVETETGWVSERKVWVCRDQQRVFEARLVRVRLKQPTEDGDTVVEILTNLPSDKVDAAKVAELYLKRWKIEGVFHELTVALDCEVDTLGYPRAALLGFCVAVAAYNVLAVVKAALRAVHGEQKVKEEVSGYYMALEWAMVYAGMMIALPAREWEVFGTMPAKDLADHLRRWAAKIDLLKIKKAPPRKPTKNKTERVKDKGPHLSTARLLEEAKKERQAKTKAQSLR
jgi:Transposase DDE domain